MTEMEDLSPCLPPRPSHGAVGSGYDAGQSGVPSKRPHLLEEFTPHAIRLILQEPEQQPPPQQLLPSELVEPRFEPLYVQSPPAVTPPLMFASGSESAGAAHHFAEAHRQIEHILLERARFQCLYVKKFNLLCGRIHSIMLSQNVPLTNPPSPCHVL